MSEFAKFRAVVVAIRADSTKSNALTAGDLNFTMPWMTAVEVCLSVFCGVLWKVCLP